MPAAFHFMDLKISKRSGASGISPMLVIDFINNFIGDNKCSVELECIFNEFIRNQ